MSKEKSGLGFWGTIISGLVVAAAIGAWPGVWPWLSLLPGRIWAHFSGDVQVAVWLLYVLGACAVAVLVGIASALLNAREPEWKSYVRDHIFGAEWRWYYVGNRITNVWARCPDCKTTLIYREEGDAFTYRPYRVILSCERCSRDVVDHDGVKDNLVGAVTRQIERNIDTDEWPRPQKKRRQA